MRTLTLRIENHSTLENGGPVSLSVTGQGAQIGRKAGNDWVLPDPSRHISGHHFDIGFEGGQYILVDVSSNGTFLYGERYRIDGAHVIQDGHRFTVGHYIILAKLSDEIIEAPEPAPTPSDEFDNVWNSFDGPDSAPAQLPRMPVLPAAPAQQPAVAQPPDYYQVGHAGTAGPAISPPILQAPSQMPGVQGGVSAPPVFQQPPVAPAQPQAQPTYQQQPPAFSAEGFGGVANPAQPPHHLAQAPQGSASDALMRGFVEGAGLNSVSQLGIPPEEMGRMLGRIAKLGTYELMQMLQDRAAVKLFVSNEDRTMRVANGNNPMKFMASADQAFEALFLNPRDGYQTGADGFENALSDVRRHQTAVIAAMQPALAEVLSGLSPEDVEVAVGGGMLGGGGRKAWDEFTKRWETRASAGENGMLDAFISAFSKYYSDALRKS